MALTGKQRAALRGMANNIESILQIGKDGVTPNVVKQADEALAARELVKGQVLKNAPVDAREALEALCAQLYAEPVQAIGYRFVLYRMAREPEKRKISI